MYIGINAVIIEAFGRCNRWESWQQVVQWLGDRKTHRRRLSDRFHRSRGWEIWAIACICNLYSCINNNNYTIDFICYVIPSATPYTHTYTHIYKHTYICTHILQLFPSVKAILLFSHKKKTFTPLIPVPAQCSLMKTLKQKTWQQLWIQCSVLRAWCRNVYALSKGDLAESEFQKTQFSLCCSFPSFSLFSFFFVQQVPNKESSV